MSNSKRNAFVVMFLCVACGCSKDPAAEVKADQQNGAGKPAEQAKQEPDPQKMAESWAKLVDAAKARIPAVQAEFKKDNASYSKNINFASSDIKKTDSVLNPMVGEIKIQERNWWNSDTWNKFEYVVKFAYRDESWHFIEGTSVMVEHSNRKNPPGGLGEVNQFNEYSKVKTIAQLFQ